MTVYLALRTKNSRVAQPDQNDNFRLKILDTPELASDWTNPESDSASKETKTFYWK